MSCYEWERGTITLPAAQVAPLKRMLREAVNDLHEKTRAEAVRRHKSANTRSVDEYAKRLKIDTWGGFGKQNTMLDATVYAVLQHVWSEAKNGRTPLHVPTVADVSRVVPKLTAKANAFPVIGLWGFHAASITFEGRRVTWDVDENNHAVDSAHEAPLAKDFFAALDRVNWTRATGGYGVGNNEYNRDDEHAGGGGNYTTFRYGPLGEAQQAQQMGMTVAKFREMRKRSTSLGRGTGS